ncbi:MAG: acetylornithine deacetylase [Rhodobacteraceae bacterium]|nr:acetylornithine deacetylase [Paracoccaceae bacterium]
MPDHYTPREMLEKLVAFPTVSDVSNLPLIDFVEDYLAGHGIKGRRVYDETGEKANFYAVIGPNVEGGVVLSGHTDVVPVVGQSWESDPFAVTEKGGKLYGRGTCDMKGFGALALALVPDMLKADLKRPIQIALSYDEEVGCLGAPYMISDMVAELPRASAVIVGEPSMMQVVSGHKGAIGFMTHVRGFEIHSSLMHQGVSAVMVAARLVEWLRLRFEENMKATPNAVDAMFEPPFTTLHVGVIKGGSATNITALDASFSCDIRCPASQDPLDWFARYQTFAKEVEAEMQAVQPTAKITIIPRDVNPALKPEENGAAEALARRLTGDNGSHVVSYGTEAGQFQREGYSVVVCGPGSIDQAHQPNEFITIEQFEAGEAFLRRLIETLKE